MEPTEHWMQQLLLDILSSGTIWHKVSILCSITLNSDFVRVIYQVAASDESSDHGAGVNRDYSRFFLVTVIWTVMAGTVSIFSRGGTENHVRVTNSDKQITVK